MHSEVNLLSYILSGAVGLLCGYVIGFGLQRPQSKVALVIKIVIGMLSPWIMVGGWAIAATIHGSNYGIHIGTWLGAFCAMVIVAYAVRAGRQKEVVAGA